MGRNPNNFVVELIENSFSNMTANLRVDTGKECESERVRISRGREPLRHACNCSFDGYISLYGA